MGICRLQAHRGVSSDRPENTMCAYIEAVKQGYDIIELDPKFTSDGHPVMLHDRTINRTARDENGYPPKQDKVNISEITLSEALSYEYGGWFDEKYRGERMPALSEVLIFSRENSMPLKFDNIMESFTDEQLEIFFSEVEKYADVSLIGFTCFSIPYMKKVISRFPAAHIHYDGNFDDEAEAFFEKNVPNERLTIWIRYDNKATSWSKTAPINEELSLKVKKYGSLGLWILSDKAELDDAVNKYHADVVETNGKIKPDDLKAMPSA